MPCILFDKYPYRKHEKHSVIPQKPMCLPENVKENIDTRKLFFMFLFIPIFMISDIIPKNLLSWLLPPAECTAAYLLILIAALMAALKPIYSKWDAITLKKIQNPQFNPEGWMYQGKILSHDDIHVIQHIEYYRKHASWIIPDGTDLNLYTPQNMDAYLEALNSKHIKCMTIRDLPDSCSLNEMGNY